MQLISKLNKNTLKKQKHMSNRPKKLILVKDEILTLYVCVSPPPLLTLTVLCRYLMCNPFFHSKISFYLNILIYMLYACSIKFVMKLIVELLKIL